MNLKKAFTLVEVVIVMIIMIILILVMIRVLKPDAHNEKAYYAKAQKMINVLDEMFLNIANNEKTQCPASKYMVKLSGSDWEFATMKSDGVNLIDSEGLVNLFSNYIKYEVDLLDFCDYSTICSSEDIKGAKVAGGTYIGFNIYENIKDCPAYRLPGAQEEMPAPKEFVNGVFQTKKCWGEVYIDVDGKKSEDTIGKDTFVLGLGEFGIEK